jgi:hypothetical protein
LLVICQDGKCQLWDFTHGLDCYSSFSLFPEFLLTGMGTHDILLWTIQVIELTFYLDPNLFGYSKT